MINKKLLLLLLSPFLIVFLLALLILGWWCFCIIAAYINFYYLFDKEEAEKIVQIDDSDIAKYQRYCAHVIKDVDYDAILKEQPCYGSWCIPDGSWPITPKNSIWLWINSADSVCLKSLEKELNIDIFSVQYNGKGVIIDLKFRHRTLLREDTETFTHSLWYNVEKEDVSGEEEYSNIKYEKMLSDSLMYVYHTKEWVGN